MLKIESNYKLDMSYLTSRVHQLKLAVNRDHYKKFIPVAV